jgi:hypothetical protein
VWSFANAFPVKWTSLDLSGASTDIASEANRAQVDASRALTSRPGRCRWSAGTSRT